MDNRHLEEAVLKDLPVSMSGDSDEWASRGDKGAWTRQHARARRSLFTPMKVGRGHVRAEEVGAVRVTRGIFDNGEIFTHTDRWKEAKDPHRGLPRPWTGFTVFSSERLGYGTSSPHLDQ